MAIGQNFSMRFDPLPLPDDTPVKAEEERQGQKVQQVAPVRAAPASCPGPGQIAFLDDGAR